MLNNLVPNEELQNGDNYKTMARVYIPSTTELGDLEHDWTYQIGSAFPLFPMATDFDRAALVVGNGMHYWMRSPFSEYGYSVSNVSSSGELYHSLFQFNYAYYGGTGVRPVLNLKADTMVSILPE